MIYEPVGRRRRSLPKLRKALGHCRVAATPPRGLACGCVLPSRGGLGHRRMTDEVLNPHPLRCIVAPLRAPPFSQNSRHTPCEGRPPGPKAFPFSCPRGTDPGVIRRFHRFSPTCKAHVSSRPWISETLTSSEGVSVSFNVTGKLPWRAHPKSRRCMYLSRLLRVGWRPWRLPLSGRRGLCLLLGEACRAGVEFLAGWAAEPLV